MKAFTIILPLAVVLTAVNAVNFFRPFYGLDRISAGVDASNTTHVAGRALRGSSVASLAMAIETATAFLIEVTKSVTSGSSDVATIIGVHTIEYGVPTSAELTSQSITLGTLSSVGSSMTGVILLSSSDHLSSSFADNLGSSTTGTETETAPSMTTVLNHKTTTEVVLVTHSSCTNGNLSVTFTGIQVSSTSMTFNSSELSGISAGTNSSTGLTISNVTTTSHVAVASTTDVENSAFIPTSMATQSSVLQQSYPMVAGTETHISHFVAQSSSSVSAQAITTTTVTLAVIPLSSLPVTSNTTAHITETLTSSMTRTHTVTVFDISSSSTQLLDMQESFSSPTLYANSLAAPPSVCSDSTVYITITSFNPASQQTCFCRTSTYSFDEPMEILPSFTDVTSITILSISSDSSYNTTATSLAAQSHTTSGVETSNDALSGSVLASASTSGAAVSPSQIENANNTANSTTTMAAPSSSPFVTFNNGGASNTVATSVYFSYFALVAGYLAAIWLFAI